MELEKREAPMENNGAPTDNLVLLTDVVNQTTHQQGMVSPIPLSHSPGKAYRVIKRCFDFLSSMVVSIILLPLLLILMVLIMIKDPGNPLYFQKRVGKGGRPIFVANLRSMELVRILHDILGYIKAYFCIIHTTNFHNVHFRHQNRVFPEVETG